MFQTDNRNDDLAQILALIEAATAAINRLGENISFDERARLVGNLEEASKRIRLMGHHRDSGRLTAAMTVIGQVREFLMQQSRH